MKNIGKIIKLAKPLRGIFYVITIIITFGALVDLAMPILLKIAVDAVTKPGVQFKTMNDLWRYPFSYALGLLVVMYVFNLLSQALSNISSRLGDHYAGKLRKFLTETFFEKSLTLSQTYYDGELSGKIINQLNRGVQVITDFFNTATNFIVPSFLQAIFTIALLAYYNPLTALFMTILFPIYIYFSAASTKNWSKYQQKRNVYEDIVRGRLSESILNIRLVRGFNNQVRELKTIAEGLAQSNKYFAKQSETFHIYDFIRNACLHTILLGVYFLTFLKTFQGRSSFGELILVIQLVNQIRRPLFAMSFVLGRVQEAENGSKEYFNILELPSRETIDHVSKPRKLAEHTVVFDHVSFAYEKDNNVLHNLNFSIEKNEMVALVGKSGAGKTTITNLIMKFYDAVAGEIRMGGVAYDELTTFDVRHHVALVFQDHELFSTSIRENVAYGSDATDAQVEQALVQAQAWGFVKELSQGMDSEIGERGVRLSGGQKQRIQIARAILKNAPILILDEATSSLDAQSEADVQKALEILMKDRIVLVIAHRFSTIRNADRIIVLDKGAIIDQGSPGELSKREGIYQDLLRFQVEGNQKLLESFELH
jgi:ATP-binding cassette subfamily B protein